MILIYHWKKKNMEIPIIFNTENKEKLIKIIFGGEIHKEIILDRAKLRYNKSRSRMEGYSHSVDAIVTMLTPFGAAAVSNFLQKKLQKNTVQSIQIGEITLKVLNDQIRESFLREYTRLHKSYGSPKHDSASDSK